VAKAERAGVRVRLWDVLFFATFALMVTQSVAVGGVLVVFSYLIIPAACGALFGNRFGTQLIVGWIVALITTIVGLAFSGAFDMPTGASLVSSFGAALVVCVVIRAFVKKTPAAEAPA
jgi:ABC-type Mn2+/Zn2+ transport system permease subunit